MQQIKKTPCSFNDLIFIVSGKRGSGKKTRGGEMPDPIESRERDLDVSASEEEDLSSFSIDPAPVTEHKEDSESEIEQSGLLSPPPAIPSRTPSRDDLLNSDDGE